MLIGDRWTPLIVRDLQTGSHRFGELQRSLGGISPKTLADRLRRLEEAGIVDRTCFAEMPPRFGHCHSCPSRQAMKWAGLS